MKLTPLTVARRLLRWNRKSYLERFWKVHEDRKPFARYSCDFPSSEEYARVKRATFSYDREKERLTKNWIKRDALLKRLDSWAFRRARRLRMTGKI